MMTENTPAAELRVIRSNQPGSRGRRPHEQRRNDRRRLALDAIAAAEMPVGLYQLAEAIASRENPDRLSADDVECIAVSLHHLHLPKLDDMNELTYDPASHRITW